MNDNNMKNGRSYLDDVEEKGYLGLMLAFFRQCTYDKEWPARREALLTVLRKMGFESGFGDFTVINRALSFNKPLSGEEFIALTRYFGVLFNSPRNVEETGKAMNKELKSTIFTTDNAGYMIGSGLRHLGDDPDFIEYVGKIAADANKLLAA